MPFNAITVAVNDKMLEISLEILFADKQDPLLFAAGLIDPSFCSGPAMFSLN